MKHSILILTLMMTMMSSGVSSCSKNDDNNNPDDNNDLTGNTIRITVGSQTFTATLANNNTVRAFRDLLPLAVNMVELNGNEKYYDLPTGLPTNASNPRTIRNGDLMLYGSRTVVLFYETFNTSYSYTRLGAVNDPSGLASALGSGNVTVTFELDGNGDG